MGFLADTVKNLLVPATNGPPISIPWGGGWQNGSQRYDYFARHGYQGNEIVHAALELLVTSASEPPLVGKRWRRNSPRIQQTIQNASLDSPVMLNLLGAAGVRRREREVLAEFEQNFRIQASARGIPAIYHEAALVRNGFIEQVTDHPLIRLLNNPNPIQSKAIFWSTLFLHYYLAGNAYILKVRGALGNVVELWLLRPDRVRIIPGTGQTFIKGYEYKVGQDAVVYAPEDVIHFRTRSTLDDYYGEPPLMAFIGRMDVDDYMRGFLRRFFQSGGHGPGAILSVKGKLSDLTKEEIRQRLRRLLAGPNSIQETLILDSTESSYTQLGLNRGLTDALPKEINAVNEARLAMAFGIPGSILGLLIGYESSSYANKRADWQVLWDVTLTPFLSEIDDALNLSLVPEFAGVDEVGFDLSQIKALQEDVDALHKRARDNYDVGLWSKQEARLVTGVEAEADPDELFNLPSGAAVIRYDELGVAPEPAPTPEPVQVAAAMAVAFKQIEAPRRGRRPLAEDAGARALYDEGQRILAANPRITMAQVAARIGVTDRTFRKYRETFGRE